MEHEKGRPKRFAPGSCNPCIIPRLLAPNFRDRKPTMSETVKNEVIVVSGLPRSGTSMMMKMLDAAGLPILTDKIRAADEDNPKGYHEFERVKKLREDKAWLPEAVGKVVKIISFLLLEVPEEYHYKVIFMRRAVPEVLKSQRQMLIRRGEDPDTTDDARMAGLYEKHLKQVYAWIEKRPSVDVVYVNHRDAIEKPREVAHGVNAFLGGGLDEDVMAAVVDPSLYRQRV